MVILGHMINIILVNYFGNVRRHLLFLKQDFCDEYNVFLSGDRETKVISCGKIHLH